MGDADRDAAVARWLGGVGARVFVYPTHLGPAGAVFCVHPAFLTESDHVQNSRYIRTVPYLFGSVRKDSHFQTKHHGRRVVVKEAVSTL